AVVYLPVTNLNLGRNIPPLTFAAWPPAGPRGPPEFVSAVCIRVPAHRPKGRRREGGRNLVHARSHRRYTLLPVAWLCLLALVASACGKKATTSTGATPTGTGSG